MMFKDLVFLRIERHNVSGNGEAILLQSLGHEHIRPNLCIIFELFLLQPHIVALPQIQAQLFIIVIKILKLHSLLENGIDQFLVFSPQLFRLEVVRNCEEARDFHTVVMCRHIQANRGIKAFHLLAHLRHYLGCSVAFSIQTSWHQSLLDYIECEVHWFICSVVREGWK